MATQALASGAVAGTTPRLAPATFCSARFLTNTFFPGDAATMDTANLPNLPRSLPGNDLELERELLQICPGRPVLPLMPLLHAPPPSTQMCKNISHP